MRSGFVILLFLAACAHTPAERPAATAAPESELALEPMGYSSADSLLLLLNTPGAFDVLRKHIPYFVNLTEHGIIPAFPTDMTLDDLLEVPEARLTPGLLAQINIDLAAVKRGY